MAIVVIEQEHMDKLIASIDELKKLVETKQKPTPPSSADKTLAEIKNYVSKEEAWVLLKCNKQKWYRRYQHIIQHKPYDNDTWVYLPSILNFLQTNNINK